MLLQAQLELGLITSPALVQNQAWASASILELALKTVITLKMCMFLVLEVCVLILANVHAL